MELLKDRRIIWVGGAALALLAGLSIAIALMGKGKQTEPPPASRAGLIVETGRSDDTKLDPARPLRCFVGGQFVGETTLSECAKKNGVATGALDELLRQLALKVVVEEIAHMDELRGLFRDALDPQRMAMPHGIRGDALHEVEIRTTVFIPYARALPAGNGDVCTAAVAVDDVLFV